jgi:hypothetical protein
VADLPTRLGTLPTSGTVNTTTPPSVGDIADAVMDEPLSGHTTAGTFGKAVSDTLAALTAFADKFAGITLVRKWLRLMAGKTADATTLTEFQGDAATTYNNTTDSQEAIRDRGDVAWTGGGGDGGGATAEAIVAALAGRDVEVSSPIRPDGTIEFVRGDAVSLAITVTGYTGPSLDGQTVSLRLIERVEYQRSGSDGVAVASFSGTATQTDTTVTVTIAIAANQNTFARTRPPENGWTHKGQLIGQNTTLKLYDVTVLRDVIGS